MKALVGVGASFAMCVHAALGVNVLVMSSTSQVIDDAVVAALKAGGHKVSIGPDFSSFTGDVDLAGVDVVYFQANANWPNPDMPDSGQLALLHFVRSGGGLITSEWVAFDSYAGDFKKLRYCLPAVYKGYGGWSSSTFTVVVPDATLNKGLPDAIEFPMDSFGGTESVLGPKCDATVFYDSSTLESGVIGWNYGIGRVLSMSTTNGATQVADPEFSKLLANAASWAALAGGKPTDGYTSDCDGSTKLDLFDFLCFTNAFNAQDPYADCDGDETFTLFDFLCFVNTFNKEC